MFRKEADVKASAAIRSSERRKFLDNVCKFYDVPRDKLSKEDELKLVPLPLKQATFKSPQGFTGTLYLDENETPVWFKTRDSDVYPSLFTSWKCPWLLPVVKTHPHVLDYLIGGAQLMLPGTVPPFDSKIKKDMVVSVVGTDHPTVPKAIGIAKMDLSQITKVVGTTGIAVLVSHTLDDNLYKLNKLVDIAIPKDLETEDPWDDNEVQAKEVDEDEVEVDDVADSVNLNETEELEDKFKDTIIDDLIAETVTSLSPEEVDSFFVKSLFQSVQQNDIECPISSSNFMSNYILKNLPLSDPNMVNIKKTSWKKSTKFLKAMEKQKYLTTKAQGKDDLVVTSIIPKTHEKIVNFVAHKTGAKKATNAQSSTSGKKDKGLELKVVFLYKGTKNQGNFLREIDMDVSKLFTANELKLILNSYIKVKDLADKNPKNIVVNDSLHTATKLTGSHPRDKVAKCFIDNFSPYYVVLKPGESLENEDVARSIKKGVPGIISIISETKIGRKVVTRVSNFEHFYIKPHVLADDLKVKCSGSCTIGPCTHNPQLTEVTVQGPHGKLITEYLVGKGVPISFIKFEDKTKGKKKR